jgi:hypothetical protein
MAGGWEEVAAADGWTGTGVELNKFLEQGTMLSVAPVSSKYLSFVSLSVKKMRPALAGKCIAVAVACV